MYTKLHLIARNNNVEINVMRQSVNVLEREKKKERKR